MMFLVKSVGVGTSHHLPPILLLCYILNLSTLSVAAVIHKHRRPCIDDYICAEFYVCSSDKVCECQPPSIEIDNMCLLTVQGSTCTQDQDCNSGNSQADSCKVRPCVCHETRCVILRSGKQCLTSQSCSHIPNAECRDFVCECKANYSSIGHRCAEEGKIQETSTSKSSTTTIAGSSTMRITDESVASLNVPPSVPALIPNRFIQFATIGNMSPSEGDSLTVTEQCPGNQIFQNGTCISTVEERRSYWPILGLVLGLFVLTVITTLVLLFCQQDPNFVTIEHEKVISRSYVSKTS